MHRRALVSAAAALLLGGVAGRAGSDAAPLGPRRVAIVASRFAFSVSEVHASRGETIELLLTTTDFVHGFALPELKARIDLVPGKQVQLLLRALPPGRYTYLCDNFCGEGHDRMTGTLFVGEAGPATR